MTVSAGILHTGGGRDLVLAPTIVQHADGDPVLARGEIVELGGEKRPNSPPSGLNR